MDQAPAPTCRVLFLPSGRRGEVAMGLSVLQAAQRLGADLGSVCGGRGLCGRCQIDPIWSEIPRSDLRVGADHLSAPNAVEARFGALRPFERAGRRLGCQAILGGDMAIEVPLQSQAHRPIIAKDAVHHAIAVDRVVSLHYVRVDEPSLADPASDVRRLARALEAQWGLSDLSISRAVLLKLQKILRTGAWQVTAAIRHRREVIALWPGLHDQALGLAVDIGSTTIAGHLCDLESGAVLASRGLINPQIRYGEDLMSRVSAIMMDPSVAEGLSGAVRSALADLGRDLAQAAGAQEQDILETVAVGNPIMIHLLLGLDPTELGAAPFALTIDQALDTPVTALDMPFAPGGYLHILPQIAGHVGADAAAVALALAPERDDAVTLIVDVGTNAEILLGNRTRLLACSSPTGPAFEGAHISCGQRAAPGAIERVRIDRASLAPRFKVIGCDLWSDHADFAAQTAATGVTGVCGSGIIELIAELRLAGAIGQDGAFQPSWAERTDRIVPCGRGYAYRLLDGPPSVMLYQTDIRAIQLAKAALYAGARLLMQRFGVTQVDRIVLAGAFGSHIDPIYAMALGMVPDCAPDCIASAGNAAGTGARIALLNAASRGEIAALARAIEKIEPAIQADFQDEFVAAMALPHGRDPYPRLQEVLPFADAAAVTREVRRRRRIASGRED